MTELIEGTPVLAREIKAIHRGNGDEAIELTDNRRLLFKARTDKSGRGLTGDRTVLDEAFALKPTHMGSLLPTMAARPTRKWSMRRLPGQSDLRTAQAAGPWTTRQLPAAGLSRVVRQSRARRMRDGWL